MEFVPCQKCSFSLELLERAEFGMSRVLISRSCRGSDSSPALQQEPGRTELSLGRLEKRFTPPARSHCSAEPDHRKLDSVIAKKPHFCKEVSL